LVKTLDGSSGASLPRFNLTSPALLTALAILFIVPGLPGHDLWKTQDAIGLGIVHDMAVTGRLLVPHVAGTPWMADAPLYHWVALVFGLLLGFAMEFHAAARLASGAFLGLAFFFIYRAGRNWTDEESERPISAAAAMLVLLGSVGVIVYAHEAVPELAGLAAMCAALAALPYAAARPIAAGARFGVALGAAFLSGTWIGPLGLLAAAVAAHIACPAWRTRAALRFLGATLACAVPLVLSWPVALAIRAPEAFIDWWAFLWYAHGSVGENVRHLIANGSWFTWPAWPLALWAAWSLRRRWREPRLFVPGATLAVMIVLRIGWGMPQDENLLLLLAPLALLATAGIFTLRRGAVAALDWFGVLAFAFFTTLVWVGYSAMMLGVPGPVARNLARIAPGFVPHVHWAGVALAVALAFAWVYLVFFTPFNPMRASARWAGGVVLLWGTFAALFMPWVDYQKSYRSVALQLKRHIPANGGCLAERGLGISQAAALDYHAGIRARPFDYRRPYACPLVLVQGAPGDDYDAPPVAGKAGWAKIAEASRPGDRAERYRLYRLRK
jgi:4-amino-4-deoxy-L-arabinose transferase-like glycosyltransferase